MRHEVVFNSTINEILRESDRDAHGLFPTILNLGKFHSRREYVIDQDQLDDDATTADEPRSPLYGNTDIGHARFVRLKFLVMRTSTGCLVALGNTGPQPAVDFLGEVNQSLSHFHRV